MKTHEKEDLRVRRTRELLMHALTELLAEKSFHRLTVQDIAERARINRVTFYGHFPDKYAILAYWLGEQFQQQVEATLPATCFLNESNLEGLIVTLMRWFAELHERAKPDDRSLLPLLFTTLPQELARLLETWYRQTPGIELPPRTSAEAVLLAMSWTIVGTSFEWSDGVRTLSPEQQAKQITALLLAGFSYNEQV